jgi:hypothetical protein
MGHINWKRVIFGGLLCGLVINLFEFLFNNVLLQNQWADAWRALGRTEQFGSAEVSAFTLWGFLVGIFAIWLYAEIRPHYGARPVTVIIAGLAVWFLGYLLSAVLPLVTNLFPGGLMLISLAVGLVEVVAGTMAGAWLYQHVTARGTSAAAAKV